MTNKIKKKIAFFDIDGTLIEPTLNMLKVQKSTLDALHALRANHIRVVAASGRSPLSVNNVIDFPFDGYISAHGATNFADGQEIYSGGLNRQEIDTLWHFLVDHQLGFVMQGDGAFYYHDDNNAGVRRYLDRVRNRNYNKLVNQISDPASIGTVLKATVFFYDQHQKELTKSELQNDFKLMFNNTALSDQAERFGCEISSMRDTKGTGIQHLLKVWGLKPEEAIAFGDNTNDLEMFELVDGYAVDNAVPELKQIAVSIIGPVNSDTIAETLIRLGLIEANQIGFL